MKYTIKVNDNLSEVYEITYDKEQLEKLFHALENYKYVNYCEINGGSIHKMPLLKSRQIELINRHSHSGKGLYDTFVITNDRHGFSFIEEYIDYPLLYKYLDILLHDKRASEYGLFGYVNGNLNYFYADAHKNELAFNAILDYIKNEDLIKVEDRKRRTVEVTQHERLLNELVKNSLKDYDILGLYKIYLEVLKCFNLKLDYYIEKSNNEVNRNGYELVLKK